MPAQQNKPTNFCPLCHCVGEPFYRNLFFVCSSCFGIFKAKKFLLNKKDEQARYKNHHNDIFDPNYQKFVAPITSNVLKNFTKQSLGLDFGAGTGPVISKILQDQGYTLNQYDPFFINTPKVLELKYDYIVCCEVIEHFYHPEKEFRLLKNRLQPNGHLYCMTHIYNPKIDFENWYYKNDPTHVFIYQEATLIWIKNNFNFTSITIDNRLILFVN